MKTRFNSACLALFVILCFANIGVGLYGSWWMLVVPAFVAGCLTRVPSVRIAMVSGVAVWWAAGLIHDIPTGLRLSMRIAGILNLPWFIFAYVAMAVIAMALTGLAAQTGQGLRDLVSARDQ